MWHALCWNVESLNYAVKTTNFESKFIYFSFNSSLYFDYLLLYNNYEMR